MNAIQKNELVKYLVNLSLIFNIIYIFIILRVPPTSGYEISLYLVYPWYFWISIILNIVIAQTILIVTALSEDKNNDKSNLGIITGFIAISVLLFLPLIRGYFSYERSDVLSHIGLVRDILNSGSINNNYYPIMHILVSILFFVSHIEITTFTMIIPPLFSIFYVGSFYLLSKHIFKKRSEILFCLVFALIPVFGNGNLALSPYPMSYLLFPFIFYLFFKSRYSKLNVPFRILLIILVLQSVFFHPLNAIMLFLIFFVMVLSSYINNILFNHSVELGNMSSIFGIIFIAFMSWQSYSYLLINSSYKAYMWLNGELNSSSEFAKYSSLANTVNLNPAEFINLALNGYGQSIMLGLLSILCILHLIHIFLKERSIGFIQLFSAFVFLVFFILTISSFFSYYIVGFGRYYMIAILFSFILIPSTICSILKPHQSSKPYYFKLAILILALIFITSFSTFNLYQSPRIKYVGQQVASSEFYGMKIFFDKRNDDLSIYEYGPSQGRFYDAIFGQNSKRKNIRAEADAALAVLPPHFGYATNSTLGSTYKDPIYFILTDAGRDFYRYVFPEYISRWKFTSGDFNTLKKDTSVEQIYTNGNLEAYLAL